MDALASVGPQTGEKTCNIKELIVYAIKGLLNPEVRVLPSVLQLLLGLSTQFFGICIQSREDLYSLTFLFVSDLLKGSFAIRYRRLSYLSPYMSKVASEADIQCNTTYDDGRHYTYLLNGWSYSFGKSKQIL